LLSLILADAESVVTSVRQVRMFGEILWIGIHKYIDLPDKLRFGRVEVSCEGWSKPGDPYVLKGVILSFMSCLNANHNMMLH